MRKTIPHVIGHNYYYNIVSSYQFLSKNAKAKKILHAELEVAKTFQNTSYVLLAIQLVIHQLLCCNILQQCL